MELLKTYRISQVHGTNFSNAPYKFLLESTGDGFPGKAGELVLDKEACERHGITPSLELVGRRIQCTLKPRPLQRTSNGQRESECSFPDMQNAGVDDMLLDEIRREEVWSQDYYVGSPHDSLHQKVTFSLHTYSDEGGDGIHFTCTNCPLYKLAVELTEDEFKECTKFAPGTVLTASFILLPANPKEEQEEQ
ncbi:MAG: hypothetical protein HY372_03645 [Candidatus Andersenbacteria bacterium]|nr:hypothetical protein [Candidatus Andersenbacteria bacterium]